MKLFMVLAACVWCFSEQTYGQSQLEFSVGANHSYIKDRHFSPLNYTHGGVNFGLGFNRISPSKESRFYTKLDVLFQDMEHKRHTHLASGIIVGNVMLGYQDRILETEKFNLYVGGEFQSGITYIDFDDQESFSFLMTHGVNLSVYSTYKLNETSRLGGEFSTPLLTLLVRPPYNGVDERLDENTEHPMKLITNGDFVWSDTWEMIRAHVFYSRNISDKMSAKIAYTCIYQHAKADNPFTRLQNQLTLGLLLTL